MIDRQCRHAALVRIRANNNERLAALDDPNTHRANRERERADDWTGLVVAVGRRCRVCPEEISFSRDRLATKFPEFPEASVPAMFDQTRVPKGHPPDQRHLNLGRNAGNSGNFSAAREGRQR